MNGVWLVKDEVINIIFVDALDDVIWKARLFTILVKMTQ